MPGAETLAFLAALSSWALRPASPIDLAEGIRGPRDSQVPTMDVVQPDAPPKPSSGPLGAPGATLRVYLPQEAGGAVRPAYRFATSDWPMTFQLHNARIRADSGKQATLDDWAMYALAGKFMAAKPGSYSFQLTFRAPIVMSCFALSTIGGAEIFPDFERKFRKALPPRVVMDATRRRSFQRDVELPEKGPYPFELAVACHPGKKPEPRVAGDKTAAWQATEVNLLVRAPGESAFRPLKADELTQDTASD